MLQYLQYRENIKILGCKIATKLCEFLNIVAEFDAKNDYLKSAIYGVCVFFAKLCIAYALQRLDR